MLSKPSLLVAGAAGGLLLWLFGPALWGGQSFAFRDAAHYYYPLLEWIGQQLAEGQWPWWNPHENLGVPLAGDNTAGLFYPGKLLFTLPLDFTLRYNLYIVAHVALAAWGAFLLPRRWGASEVGAGISTLSYAFGSSVLFQTCNVIYLVGAAWLPWALLAADRMLRQRSWSTAAVFGAVLALMVTGGDPQMAYNATLLAGLYGLILWRAERRGSQAALHPATGTWLTARLTLLLASGAFGLLLAAVQVLPSMEATAYGSRASYDSPRNLYELGRSLATAEQAEPALPWHAGLLGQDFPGHQRQIYQFGLTPWRVVELAWPNINGSPFPTHRRWMSALGWEGSLWAPSLYLGLLPLGLAAVTWSLRRAAKVETRLASWMVALGGLASLGSYGLAWLAGLPFGGSEAFGVGGEVGGVYWWLTVLLPGYVYFRYPAKLFVVATLGFSLLAARGWDESWRADSRGLMRFWIVLVGFSLAGLAVLPLAWPWFEAAIEHHPADPLLGPFDAAGAWHDIAIALLHTALLATALAALWMWSTRQRHRAGLASVVAIALTTLDLGFAQSGLLAFAPAGDWETRPEIVDKLPADIKNYRVFRQLRVLPPTWQDASSADRYGEVLRWNRATLAPKFGLRYGISLAEAAGTVAPYDYSLLLDLARQDAMAGSQTALPPASILDLIAARVAIVESGRLRDDIQTFDNPAEGMSAGLRPSAQRRARIVHDVTTLRAFDGRARSRLEARTREILFSATLRDWPVQAVVECDEPLDPLPSPSAEAADERCIITGDTPTQVELEVNLASSGLLVLADQFYPGWQATVESAGQTRVAPIVRTNRVLRGVALPAGRHRVTFRYRPWTLALGAAISLPTMVGLLAWAVAGWLSRRNRGARTPSSTAR